MVLYTCLVAYLYITFNFVVPHMIPNIYYVII